MELSDLRRLSLEELRAMAGTLNISYVAGLRKPDLLLRVERALLSGDAVLRADGTLEILDEGYGFLRSPEHSYLAGPDDIYVSPSQI